MTAPILLVTCGNSLAGDDAFGPRLADLLARAPIAGLDAVDLGMRPDRLFDHLVGRDALIVVDAALCPDLPAGHVIECDWQARPTLAEERAVSSHGISLTTQIELAGKLGLLPSTVWLIAVNICGSRPGVEMSPVIAAQVEPVRKRIAELAQRLTKTPLTEIA
jgi:hydrogenase maturation protease